MYEVGRAKETWAGTTELSSLLSLQAFQNGHSACLKQLGVKKCIGNQEVFDLSRAEPSVLRLPGTCVEAHGQISET